MITSTFSFANIRRFPDLEAANLVAVDATDRLLLDEAAGAIEAAGAGGVVVVEDHYGALTLGAAALHGATAIRVYQDALVGEQALQANAARTGLDGCYRSLPLDAGLFADAAVVLVQAPKSLAELQEIVQLVARSARPDVALFVGGRVKHLTLTMNDVLRSSFTDVRASLARQKSRVLIARGPQPRAEPVAFPQRQWHPDLGLWICAHGAAFAGTKIDIGTRFLLSFLPRMNPNAEIAVDLGCGTGVLAAELARSRPGVHVEAIDQSAAAVASAEATMAANGILTVRVQRGDGLTTVPDASVDLILSNPPFHVGTTVHAPAALRLLDDAARVLRPGGELWTVYNSHLDHRAALERAIGPTRIIGRNPKFTVTRTVPRHGPSHSSPSHSGPSHSGPSHSGPSHSGPSHSGPSHSGPSHSRPLNSH